MQKFKSYLLGATLKGSYYITIGDKEIQISNSGGEVLFKGPRDKAVELLQQAVSTFSISSLSYQALVDLGILGDKHTKDPAPPHQPAPEAPEPKEALAAFRTKYNVNERKVFEGIKLIIGSVDECLQIPVRVKISEILSPLGLIGSTFAYHIEGWNVVLDSIEVYGPEKTLKELKF